MKVLMVCKGNICRSPMAEAILLNKVSVAKLDIEVMSAGTESYHVGESYDARTIKTLQQHDIEFTGMARQFSRSDFDYFDWIFVADSENLNALSAQFGYSAEQHPYVKRMTVASEQYGNENVPDPYYGQSNDFERVYQLLDESMEKLVESIVNKSLRGKYA